MKMAPKPPAKIVAQPMFHMTAREFLDHEHPETLIPAQFKGIVLIITFNTPSPTLHAALIGHARDCQLKIGEKATDEYGHMGYVLEIPPASEP